MEKISKEMIAPCGMNCGLCLHFLRTKDKCPGCNAGRKVNNRPIKCGIRLCPERKDGFCFECGKFPCDRLQRLDKRYRERYGMSEIENLEHIRDLGIDDFVKKEQNKYQSEGKTFCVHDQQYY